ncbi:MAG: error-prone DNA polymerase [Myxococcota bacterium]|nr:error-prone DNA polymerase [Myxococcota bacterium]
MYVELFARTNFSFLRGGSPPRVIVQRAAELGFGSIGIADCDGLYGMVRALEAAEEIGLRLVVGCELALDDAPLGSLWLHVENGEGYANLCRLLTDSHARHPKGKSRKPEKGVARNQFAGLSLNAVSANANGLWCTIPVPTREAPEIAALRDAFGDRLSVAVWCHLDGEDDVRIASAQNVARKFGVPVCATNRPFFAVREEKVILDVLTCIREGMTLDNAGRVLLPNAEAHLKPEGEMQRLFCRHPSWLARAAQIADSCRFSLRELKYRFPSEPETPGETPDQALRRLTLEGATRRWPYGVPHAIAEQIEKELLLIANIQVAPYFLSVHSIVVIARSKNILCQGRGSAANSAVCYCLGITAVDPSRANLLFERFLSNERREPPDIDVDFEHERREEVIQAIYDKYGRARAAMVSEVISYRGKSGLRDVGKTFGLSIEQVDRLASLVSWWDDIDGVPRHRITECGFDAEDETVRHVLAMAHAIQGYPRHLSIHVGGFVLSAEPLVNIAPVEPATMPNRTVIPWDKDDLGMLGFFKVDVLGLGMLTAIRKALAMVQDDERIRAPHSIEQLARLPPEDPQVYDALCAADTVGVFQIESRAQMAMLPRLLPRNFYDLVVEVAIVRPGPIQGGMVHPYLRRRNREEEATLPHSMLAPILARTLGVPLFQEQVMQLAIVGAGYSGGEADQLRRDMAAWRRNGKLERHRERLLEGFAKNGVAREFGERLYQSIEGFGEYGFPESHAASFALLVYASAWLKVHHPAAFAAALVNSQPMGFYSVGTIVNDAERHGVEVLPVRVDVSEWDCTLEGGDRTLDGDGPALRLGLRLVRRLGEEAGLRIVAARRARRFAGTEDLVDRASLTKSEMDGLAYAGALAGFGLARREAMWKVRTPREQSLFAGVDMTAEIPALLEMSRGEQLSLDYQTTGVAVGDHAMKVVRPRLPSNYKSAHELAATPHGTQVSTAGLVICRQRPQTASGVVFVTLEDETGFVNLILWAKTFDRWRHVVTSSSMLVAHGIIERQGNVVYVVPQRLETLTGFNAPSMSRDFH